MKFININKIVMTIIKHGRVVSRLPLICTAKHKCPGTSEVQEKTRSKNIKDTSIKIIPQLTVSWDKHITLRMTIMLSRKCSKKIVETHPISTRLALRRGKQGFNMC